jgi:hypothetical protein
MAMPLIIWIGFVLHYLAAVNTEARRSPRIGFVP